MSITKTKTPNEFLVRWDDAGALKGAHIVFREAITEDGAELSSKLLPAQGVALAGSAGFPLQDVIDAITASALASNEAQAAEIVTLKADKEAAEKARDEALAQAEALQAQIDAMKPA